MKTSATTDTQVFDFNVGLDGCFAELEDCEKAIILWSKLRYWSTEALQRESIEDQFDFAKESLEYLLDFSKDKFTITIGDWKGTTEEFRDSKLTYRDISEAIQNNQFEITVISC